MLIRKVHDYKTDCILCKKYLKFENDELGFMPPIILLLDIHNKSDKTLHETCYKEYLHHF